MLVYEFGSATLFRTLEGDPPGRDASDASGSGSGGSGGPAAAAARARGAGGFAGAGGGPEADDCSLAFDSEGMRLASFHSREAALRVWSFATTTWRSAAHSMLRGGATVLCSKKIVVEPARQVRKVLGVPRAPGWVGES